MRIPFNTIVNFILTQCKQYKIDESHALNHALNVFTTSIKIYDHEKESNPFLEQQKRIIFTSALIHDTCDSKYTDETTSLQHINTLLVNEQYRSDEIGAITNIITKMSYHKIKQHGFPDMGDYQCAFNIVREADLLCGYDFNRVILYGIYKQDLEYIESFRRSRELYYERMDNQISDGLFFTYYGKQLAIKLNEENKDIIKTLEKILDKH